MRRADKRAHRDAATARGGADHRDLATAARAVRIERAPTARASSDRARVLRSRREARRRTATCRALLDRGACPTLKGRGRLAISSPR
jgi:hypothetical protein